MNNNSPNVKPGDWIFIGDGHKLRAVVCNIIDKDLAPIEGEVEVVFIDSRNRPINEGVVWTGSCWEIKSNSLNGGYADRSDRLEKYIDILRRGIKNGSIID